MAQRVRRNSGARSAILALLLSLALLLHASIRRVQAFAPPAGVGTLAARRGGCVHVEWTRRRWGGEVPCAERETKATPPPGRDVFMPAALGALPGGLATSSSLLASSIESAPLGRALCVLSGASVLIFYHVRQYLLDRSGEAKSWCSHQADVREKWSRHVRDTEGWLYAVQTLRNAITTNTFLATTVITLLTLISGKIWDILRNDTAAGSSVRSLLMVKFASVALCMLASAYHFLQSARLMTHAGFMFPAAPRRTLADAIMRRSQITQWLGLRWLYISLSAISWTVGGDRVFLATSVALVMFFRNIDRVPVGVEGVVADDDNGDDM